jgi:hypothetical protein
MSRPKLPSTQSRRGFIRQWLAACGGLFALSATSRLGATPDMAEAPSATPQSLGYRESEHVQRYYRVARF